jgi:arylformamidase
MNCKIIDLTHPLENGMIKFNAPWHLNTEISELGKISEVGRNTKKVVMSSHAGTHMDAPLHFVENGLSIDKIDLNTSVGDVIIIDFSNLVDNTPITKGMIEKFEVGHRTIFKFGWSEKWNTKEFYNNYPYFTTEAANWLVQKGVRFIGLDTPSPDDSRTIVHSQDDSIIHKIFLENGVILAEYLNMTNVHEYTGWKIIALPMKILGSDGAPARIILYKEE